MAIVIETGAGVDNAVSYVTVDEADLYHQSSGNSAWTGTDAAKEAALVRGARMLEGLPWKGVKTARTNPLVWPRIGATDGDGRLIDADEIPAEVKRAQCEAALKELVEPGVLTPDLQRGGMVKKEKVADLEVEYADGAPAGTIFSGVEQFLRGLLRPSTAWEVVKG